MVNNGVVGVSGHVEDLIPGRASATRSAFATIHIGASWLLEHGDILSMSIEKNRDYFRPSLILGLCAT